MNKLISDFKLDYIIKKGTKYIYFADFDNKILHSKKNFIDDDYNDYYAYYDDLYHKYKIKKSDIFKKESGRSSYKEYVSEVKILEILKKLNSHPEHYNAQQILGIQQKYRKKDEIELLSIIYKNYRHKYNIIYQYPIHEFKIDCLIEIGTNGGLAVEIDENSHGNYSEMDNEHRQTILEGCGYHFYRISPNMNDENVIIDMIDKQIKEYELLYSIEIDPNALWEQLQNKSIDKDFFNMIGKSIVCNVKYCVDFDDALKYLEYSKKANAVRLLQSKFTKGLDYIAGSKNNILSRDDILSCLPVKSSKINDKKWGGHNKEYIFLTKFAFYAFALLSQTRKGKEIRMWLIEIYNKYYELLTFTRNKLIEKQTNKHSSHVETIKLYKERAEEKQKRYRNQKAREIKQSRDALKNTQNLYNDYRTKYNDFHKSQNIAIDIVKKSLDKYHIDYIERIISLENQITQLQSIIIDNYKLMMTIYNSNT
jgi:prophage antirepressor-like protein